MVSRAHYAMPSLWEDHASRFEMVVEAQTFDLDRTETGWLIQYPT